MYKTEYSMYNTEYSIYNTEYSIYKACASCTNKVPKVPTSPHTIQPQTDTYIHVMSSPDWTTRSLVGHAHAINWNAPHLRGNRQEKKRNKQPTFPERERP